MEIMRGYTCEGDSSDPTSVEELQPYSRCYGLKVTGLSTQYFEKKG